MVVRMSDVWCNYTHNPGVFCFSQVAQEGNNTCFKLPLSLSHSFQPFIECRGKYPSHANLLVPSCLGLCKSQCVNFFFFKLKLASGCPVAGKKDIPSQSFPIHTILCGVNKTVSFVLQFVFDLLIYFFVCFDDQYSIYS